ncbi:MAG: SDR family oxidoreductase [Anaerolineaceae bacterium]|nr:SDR family oxidoreductase [Anaerolineaceae bacterium]
MQYGVRVNAVVPGYVSTDMTRRVWGDPDVYREFIKNTPLRRFAQPEEMGLVVVFLTSDASSYITGIALFVDGADGQSNKTVERTLKPLNKWPGASKKGENL